MNGQLDSSFRSSYLVRYIFWEENIYIILHVLLKYFSAGVCICLSSKSLQKVTWISLREQLVRSSEEYILSELFTMFLKVLTKTS